MTAPIVFVGINTDRPGYGARPSEISLIRRNTHGFDALQDRWIGVDLSRASVDTLRAQGFYQRHPVGRKVTGLPPLPTGEALTGHDAAKWLFTQTFDALLVCRDAVRTAYVLAAWMQGRGYAPAWADVLSVESFAAGAFGEPPREREHASKLGVDAPTPAALSEAQYVRSLFDAVAEPAEADA